MLDSAYTLCMGRSQESRYFTHFACTKGLWSQNCLIPYSAPNFICIVITDMEPVGLLSRFKMGQGSPSHVCSMDQVALCSEVTSMQPPMSRTYFTAKYFQNRRFPAYLHTKMETQRARRGDMANVLGYAIAVRTDQMATRPNVNQQVHNLRQAVNSYISVSPQNSVHQRAYVNPVYTHMQHTLALVPVVVC